MPFDLKNTNPAERFYYPDYATAMAMPEDKREWVEQRLCIGDPLKEIEKQTDTKKFEHVQPKKKNGKINHRAPLQRIEFVETDEELHHELTFDFTIYDWQIFDDNGNPIPCNLENKMIMLGIFKFNQFVGENMEKQVDGDKERAEDQESNLPTTVSGSQESRTVKSAGKHTPHTKTEKNPTAKTA